MKIMCWRFHIKTRFTFWVVGTCFSEHLQRTSLNIFSHWTSSRVFLWTSSEQPRLLLQNTEAAFHRYSQNLQDNTFVGASFLISCSLEACNVIRKETPVHVLCNFKKKRHQHSCFLINFEKFSWTPFLQNTLWRLFLEILLSSCFF